MKIPTGSQPEAAAESQGWEFDQGQKQTEKSSLNDLFGDVWLFFFSFFFLRKPAQQGRSEEKKEKKKHFVLVFFFPLRTT